MRCAALVLALAATACADETISGYADPSATYVVTEIDGAPFAPRATIAFPEQGTARGEGPCNSWSASQTAPYPWIELGPILATKRACADLPDEARFFDALGGMRIAEVSGPVLILIGENGRQMVFAAE